MPQSALAYTSRQKSDLHWINQVRSSHYVKPALYLGKSMTKRAQYWAEYLLGGHRNRL